MPRKHKPYVYDRARARRGILRILGEPDIRLVPAPPGWRPRDAMEALEDRDFLTGWRFHRVRGWPHASRRRA